MSTFVQYSGDGDNRTFVIPFNYILQSHVQVKVGAFVMTNGAHYDFSGPNTITFRPAFTPALNVVVELRRATPTVPLVDFQNGANLLAVDLNTAVGQLSLVTEEIKDLYEARLAAGLSRLTTGTNVTVDQMIDAITQEVLNSALLAELQTRIGDIDTTAEAVVANTSSITNLQSQINALGVIDTSGIGTMITNEQNARIAGDTAIVNTIALIGAKNGASTAFILDMTKVQVDATTSLGTRLSGIDSNIAGANAAIATETSARTAADSAFTTSLTALTARVTTAEGTLGTTGTSLSALTTRVATAESSLSAETTARASGDSTNASAITALTSRVTTVEGSASSLTTRITTAEAGLSSEATTRAAADTANATSITTLTARVTTAEGNISSNTAAITNEATVRSNSDIALSSQISTVSATANSRNRTFRQTTAPAGAITGDIWYDSDDNNKVYRWDGTAWVDSTDVRIGVNTAAISTESTTRANADSALSSSITTLQSRVTTAEGNISTASVSISANTTAITSANGNITTLQGRYGVKVDVNGYVSGFGLLSTANNGTPTSEFIVLADKFAVVTPGTAAVVPFSISGGVVYMQNVVIQDALIANLNVSKLLSGNLGAVIGLNGNINVGTGKIVFDNGIVARFMGTGFGTSSQFIDWYGPRPAGGDPALCSEATATYYLRTDGQAFFGGALLAGVLRNSVQGTNLTSTNEAILGPFSSNGGSILINGSFSFLARNNYPGTTTGESNYNAATKSNPTFTIVMSRNLGAAGFVDVGTHTVTGSFVALPPNVGAGEPGFISQGASWSTTYVDPTFSTATREYKLRFTSWVVNKTVLTNTLSLTSTES